MNQAQGDLAHARNDLDSGFYDWACFSAQQAAEKAAKAVLFGQGAVPWGHSVSDLVEEIGRATPVAVEIVDAALDLDKAYIASRYPDAHPSGAPRARYTRQEAERLVGHAERVIEFCTGLLPAP